MVRFKLHSEVQAKHLLKTVLFGELLASATHVMFLVSMLETTTR